MQEIEEKYKDKGVKVLGLLIDGELDTGRIIMDKKGGKYINILHTESLIDGFLDEIMYVPTTVIVDSRGALVGEMIVGAKSFKVLSELIDNILQ